MVVKVELCDDFFFIIMKGYMRDESVGAWESIFSWGKL